MLRKIALAACMLAMVGAGPAFSATKAAPAATTAASTPDTGATAAPATIKGAKKARKAAGPRSAKSIACSQQANQQKLHGKERQKFRRACMKKA